MLTRILLLLALMFCSAAHALTPEQARAMAAGDTDDRVAALAQASAQPDAALATFVQAQ